MRGRSAGQYALGLVAVLVMACGKGEAGSGKREVAGAGASGAGGSAAPGSAVQAPPSESGPAGAVQYYAAAELARAADALAGGGRTGRTLGANAAFQYIVMRRTSDGGPEVHDRWADVTFVQAGHGALVTDGRVNGGAVTAPGEHRGGTIVGGTRRAIGAGDLFVIPAGVPHQFLVARGDSLRYLTVKVARDGGR